MKPLDWERNWRGGGIVFAVLLIVASVIYGNNSQPKVGASAEKLVSFYDGDRTRIPVSYTHLTLPTNREV